MRSSGSECDARSVCLSACLCVVFCAWLLDGWLVGTRVGMTSEDSVLHLDASSDKKFSRHLIFHLPSNTNSSSRAGAAFASNLAMGRYVRQLMDVLRKRTLSNPDDPLSELFVRTEAAEKTMAAVGTEDAGAEDGQGAESWEASDDEASGEADEATTAEAAAAEEEERLAQRRAAWQRELLCREPMVDMGVYTKNRCFRLYLCGKYGNTDPNRVLQLHNDGSDGASSSSGGGASLRPERGTYLKSLVTNVARGATLLEYGDDPAPLAASSSAAASQSSQSSQQPMDVAGGTRKGGRGHLARAAAATSPAAAAQTR
eukprot:COSAG06_NODE_4836_length_3919_cov_4.689005_6_plen_314_part_01